MSELERSAVAVAHELKTPLVLLRQLTLALERSDDISEQSEIIKRLRFTSERSLRLVDSLTKTARLEDALFEFEPVQMNNLCMSVVDELSPLAQAHEQNLKLRLTRQPLVAVGNRDLLNSLLTGMIDNAIQHNPAGARVEVASRLHGGEAVVSVRDFGSTIDLSDFRALKESIGKRALPISARPLSSGLGLFIASQFLTAMDGRLSIERHYSGGMTFSAHVPLSRQLSLLEV